MTQRRDQGVSPVDEGHADRGSFGRSELEALLDGIETGRGARDAVVVPVPSSSPLAVSEVRSTVQAIVEPALEGENRREVQIVSSELVTNALQHGDPPVRIVLHETDDDVIIAVYDRGDGTPSPDSVETPGLRIVDDLSSGRWGVLPRDGGKWVWAVVSRAAHHEATTS